MGNRLSKIYTRTGDKGVTGLGDGSRVDKDSLRVEAYGTVDELNSAVGLVLAAELPSPIRQCLVRVQHELFDRSGLDPSVPENVGKLGHFAPRLTNLSTSFELGPQTSVIRWLDRLIFGGDEEGAEEDETQQVLPSQTEAVQPTAQGQGAFTGNPLGTGGGPWRLSASYSLTRPPRTFDPSGVRDDRTSQTLSGYVTFQLTPNWSVNWNTSYSLDMGEFATHHLNFSRDLHEWQANFSFYQTPNGNTGFEFYVELIHNRDLRFDYSERNLGIDRPNR